jgi:hypothetical protein
LEFSLIPLLYFIFPFFFAWVRPKPWKYFWPNEKNFLKYITNVSISTNNNWLIATLLKSVFVHVLCLYRSRYV